MKAPALPPAWAELAARVIPTPDQTRYGPREPNIQGEPAERAGCLLFVQEGRTTGMAPGELGWSATCRCGWVMWTPTKQTTQAKATAPKARGGHECKYVKAERGED